MIITKELEISIERRNITHYRNLGYELKVNTLLLIPVEQLMRGAKNKIIVSCDICNKEYSVIYKDYLNSNKIHNFDVCNKCKYHKSKITNIDKYGHIAPLGNKDILEKYFITNNERYGGNSSSCCKEILDKQRQTRIKNGIEIEGCKEVSEFKKYRNRVDNLTKKLKSEFLREWNGHDYYDNEYIKDNFNLKHYDKNYPTFEHKTSVFHGFVNGIDEKVIANINNLAITKRWINSSRGNKDIEEFKKYFKNLR